MKSMPSSRTFSSTRMARSWSSGGPQIPSPVMRIAPKPRRRTSRSPPILKVPDALTFIRGSYPSCHRVHPPGLRDAFENVLAAVLERELGAGDEIANRPRDEHLPVLRQRGHPCADVH